MISTLILIVFRFRMKLHFIYYKTVIQSGIFQLESDGMRQALRDIRPTHFLDIVAVNALFRPGPMEFIAVYARRKHGQEPVIMPHPALEQILRETYGVIVYQEQIMRIANVMAGFTIGEADLLRRAVSKKKREVLEEQRNAFVNGAMHQGFPAANCRGSVCINRTLCGLWFSEKSCRCL